MARCLILSNVTSDPDHASDPRVGSAGGRRSSASCTRGVQASAGRTRDKPVLFVDDIALDEPHEPAGANHPRFRAEHRFDTGRRKLIFNSRVVKLSSAASVV
jgi:hypothetical protein